jgi:exodeoxyribonuclease VII large subunit
MPNSFTVTQLVGQIKKLLEREQTLRNVWLQGEVSNFVRATSGRCYFTLKDDRAVLSCVMWKQDALRLGRLPQNGQQVLVHGYVSVYDSQGKLQFYADALELAGVGRLYQEFEATKARLAAEGLFDTARKRPLPAWPQRVGVVTSARAAALRDILRTLALRFPAVDVLLAPSAVQGDEAPAQIVAAVELLNAWNAGVEPIDLIILARGGGSIEELWAFNDERVARAIAASAVPVISGVGHETDFTLADLAADLRAPTPTGAAATAVPDRLELAGQVAGLRSRQALAISQQVANRRQQLNHSQRMLARLSPRDQIANRRQQVDDLSQAMQQGMRHRLALHRSELNGLRARLANLNPHAVLQRGYAIVYRQPDGQIVTSAQAVAAGDALRIVVADGEFSGVVTNPAWR